MRNTKNLTAPGSAGHEARERIVRRKRSRMAVEEAIWGYAFIAPVVLGLALFYTLPSIASLGFSLTKWDGLSTPTFIGLQNFADLMKDEQFLRSLVNTLAFTFISVPLSVFLATLLAVLLNAPIKGRPVYRMLYFIPVVTMPIASGMVWRWLFNSEFGFLNYLLGLVHLPQPNWLFDDTLALLSIILVSVWSSIGYNAVILLAGLQGISSTYYEAASLDGASAVRKFFHITVPLLSPSLFFVLVISLINSLQVFDLIFIMFGKDQTMLDATRTVVFGVWESGFKYFNMGYASAQAWILSVFMLLMTALQMYLQKKWVHYE
ncbi:sugar ABC transporter permease [Paenibacillus sp. J31TS4]|uniref:carbohydrate ABC transporter permease n=1 Tax=Paenibacillus sp. J31TS4 TaxID=2807195 RepID=UPI001B011005|nr:sugar ABC transporter permease [Paenibacillus sp. J31TS4]GIP39457.1 sugar ABC transporter permease [Paenibacillus sp. J31TS4]